LFPDINDPAWRCTWENVRPDSATHFKPKMNFDSSRMFTCTDTFSGSRRKEGSVCEARSAKDGRAFARAEGSAVVKGRAGRVLETSRERQKPATPRLVFDGRKEGESRKRGFEEYMKEKEGELRAAWLREEEETRGPGRWTEGHNLGLALRPTEPINLAGAYRGADIIRAGAVNTLEKDIISTSRHAPLYMPQPEPAHPLPVSASEGPSQFSAASEADVPMSCGPPYVSYPGPPLASPVVSLTSSYEPAPKYQAPDSLSAAVA
jgi:hypothetical protein